MKKVSILVSAVFLFAFASSIAQVEGKVSRIFLTSSNTGGTISVNSDQVATWQTSSFPEGAKVNINLIQKVSDSPVEYKLVRQIAVATANDGVEAWKPQKSDMGSNLSVEVGCADSSTFSEGCVSDTSDAHFAVKGGIGTNIANVIEAFTSFISRLLGI